MSVQPSTRHLLPNDLAQLVNVFEEDVVVGHGPTTRRHSFLPNVSTAGNRTLSARDEITGACERKSQRAENTACVRGFFPLKGGKMSVKD